MNPALNNIDLDTAPRVFSINEFGEAIEIPQNTDNEFEYDINIMAMESLIGIINNYEMRTSHMDFNWRRVVAQSHIQLIISTLQESL